MSCGSAERIGAAIIDPVREPLPPRITIARSSDDFEKSKYVGTRIVI